MTPAELEQLARETAAETIVAVEPDASDEEVIKLLAGNILSALLSAVEQTRREDIEIIKRVNQHSSIQYPTNKAVVALEFLLPKPKEPQGEKGR